MLKDYILLTAARNEEQYIGEALRSITRQTIQPKAWFIVDDRSTDGTAALVREYASRYPFIHLLSAADSSQQRSFGSKDKAINAAYERAKHLEFDFVGMLDADIALERDDYYERILESFAARPKLGIAGGYIYERSNGVWQVRKGNSEDSVAGGIQVFRRACYEQIGGYTPMHHGGEDWLAQLDARMLGWEVLACPQYRVWHYRPTSSAGGHWRGLFRLGMMDASFGSHPVFELVKCARRLSARPIILGAALRLLGYAWWNTSGRKPVLSREQVAFLRQEQLAKMWRFGRRSRSQAKNVAAQVSV